MQLSFSSYVCTKTITYLTFTYSFVTSAMTEESIASTRNTVSVGMLSEYVSLLEYGRQRALAAAQVFWRYSGEIGNGAGSRRKDVGERTSEILDEGIW